MSNKKATKRALLTSVMALALCMVMLVGTTFAWFTDTASTKVNKIQAGKLDVALEMKQGGSWVSAEGKTLDFVKAEDAGPEEKILWEPGCTYALPELRVVNNGNLALKYKIQVTGINGDAKLNKAIVWTIGDTTVGTEGNLAAGASTGELTIKGHMKEDAGNEYQGLSIDGISVTVYATQDTVEYDSFNNTYDANATYDFTAAKETVSAIFADVYNNLTGNTKMLTWAQVQEQIPAVADVSFYTAFSVYSGDAPTTLVISGVTYTADSTIKISVGNSYFVEDKVFYCDNGIVYLAAPMAVMEAADYADMDTLTVNKVAFRGGETIGSVTGNGNNSYAVTVKRGDSPLCIFYEGVESTDLAITRKVSTSRDGVTSVAYGTTGTDMGNDAGDYALRFYPVGWVEDGETISGQYDGASMEYTIYVQGKGMMKLNFTYTLDV